MDAKDALDLLFKLSEATAKSWDTYSVVTLAIVGFVATNREVAKNMALRRLVVVIFTIFAFYSGYSLKTF